MKTGALVAVRCGVASLAIVLLSQMRPAWPELPSSLDAPLTVTAVERTVVLGLWIAACAVVVGLLLRTIATALTRRPPRPRAALDLSQRDGPRPGRTAVPAAPRFAPSYTVTRPVPPAEATLNTPDPTSAPSVATADPVETSQDECSRGGVAISLLGPLSIDGVDEPRRAATKELIAYLALNGEATRDQLLEALWPGEDPRRTRPRLWQSVSEAARLLGDPFVRKRDRYRLDHERVELDTAELDRLIASADRANDPAAERAALEAALALWRGDPLAGADYRWAEGAVRHLEASYVDLLERVARARLEAGDAPAALDAAERGIATDELHEGFWRLALQAEGDLGRRDALNERYEALRRLLDERLGLQPHRATNTLYRRLLGQG
jgi:DNA-binding SARP family transcriptional activator